MTEGPDDGVASERTNRRKLALLAAGAAALVAGIVSVVLLASGGDGTATDMTYRQPSESMRPTMDLGDQLRVDTQAYGADRTPQAGDIVLFHPPVGSETNTCGARQGDGEPCRTPTPEASDVHFAKRIVAGPGDKVAVLEGRVILNGTPQAEPFITPCADTYDPTCNFPVAIEVPPEHYFVLGDHRAASDESAVGTCARRVDHRPGALSLDNTFVVTHAARCRAA